MSVDRDKSSSRLSEVSETSDSSEETKVENKVIGKTFQVTDMKVFKNISSNSKNRNKKRSNKIKINKIRFNIRNNLASPILKHRLIKGKLSFKSCNKPSNFK